MDYIERLRRLAINDARIADEHGDGLGCCELDPKMLALVRLAALVAVDGAVPSYGAQADRSGRPKAVRAVGAANGANPLPIVVPCHRAIGSNGTLTGFGGGLPLKQALLARLRGARDGQSEMFAPERSRTATRRR